MTNSTFECATCGFYSAWLPSAGDCMRHAYLRRFEMITDKPVRESRPANMVGKDDSCADWAVLDHVRSLVDGADLAGLYKP